MSVSFGNLKKKPLIWLYAGGALLLLMGGWLWWAKVAASPERVFWQTIEQGLESKGVTIQAEQSNDGTKVHQTLQYSLGVANLSHTLTSLTQAGTLVKNEMVGTPTADYTRYASIKTDQKSREGKKLDFSKIVGVWAKSKEGSVQFFPEAVLGTSTPLGGMAVPIGNVNAKARANLIKQIRTDKVYQVAFGKVKKERVGGRLLYTYDVTIQPVAYATLMKQFASSVGLHNLDRMDPKSFKGQEALKLRLTVDVRSQRVVSASVPGADYKQTYTSYDLPVRLDLPTKTITVDELQKRLSRIE